MTIADPAHTLDLVRQLCGGALTDAEAADAAAMVAAGEMNARGIARHIDSGRTRGRRHYYVSAIDGTRKFLVAGPYATHDAALSAVDAVRRYAFDTDPRAYFMAWGTSGADVRFRTPLGPDWSGSNPA